MTMPATRINGSLIVLLTAAACEGPFVPPPEGPPPPPPPASVASVQLAPDSATVIAGDTLPLLVTLRDSAGNVISGRPVTWLTGDSLVATVTPAGVVQGLQVGTTTIRAASNGRADTVTVFVTPVYYTAVAAGALHACALANNQLTYCWGDDSHGQTGTRVGVFQEPTPRAVASTARFASVAPGGDHSCALTAAGVAHCWGRNDQGQLGRNAVGNDSLPGPIVSTLRFTILSAGGGHTCGLDAGGLAYCWGVDASGQLGDGGLTFSATPHGVFNDIVFATLAAGGGHTCALTALGAAYCWGSNSAGQLGNGSVTGNSLSTTPTAVAGGLVFGLIAAGGPNTCALTAAGAAYCWGANDLGQLGTGVADSFARTPQPVTGGLTFRAITVGGRHSCGLTTDSLAYCWGDDGDGQLGDGAPATPAAAPVPVSGGLHFAELHAGGSHTCGITAALVVYCWGLGTQGQLGQVFPQSSAVPLRVVGQP
jgi:alpha-tubulin suppressor-like RCC1 family protein